jgi:hypothetical protein
MRTRDYWKVRGFKTSMLSAGDMDLGLRVSLAARTTFNPEMVMYASARRAREGYVKILLEACQQQIRVLIPRKPPSGKGHTAIRQSEGAVLTLRLRLETTTQPAKAGPAGRVAYTNLTPLRHRPLADIPRSTGSQ